MTKYIVVVGGVISGVGKGVTTASLGKIMKEYGFKTTLIKIDPYLNYDAGTLRPTEHGEVWVTEDGGEIDQDLGTYERFMDVDLPKKNNITTGQIYKTVIDRERRGEYLGQTVQCIPHIPDEIIRRVKEASDGYDVAIVEVGGIVGDYENKPFLFALRALARIIGANNVAYVLVAYVPVPSHLQEMKIRPVRQAIQQLNEEGISPDLIICRAEHAIDNERKEKIEIYAHIASEFVIAAPDVETIYQIPGDLMREKVGEKILAKLDLQSRTTADWSSWQSLVAGITAPQKKVRIALIGKYCKSGDYTIADSYVSIYQALIHAGADVHTRIDIEWLDAQRLETDQNAYDTLSAYDGILVPGGFGAMGVEGKIKAITYARTHNVPYLGLCYGMQLAVVEYARSVCGLHDAHTIEVNPATAHPVITILETQKKLLADNALGGTMRLGAYKAQLMLGSHVHQLYRAAGRVDDHGSVSERHRHRYEVNPAYVTRLQAAGLICSGMHEREDGTRLVEFIELADHPFFIATQAHPEFKSRLGNPSPLFKGYVAACLAYQSMAVAPVRSAHVHVPQV